MYKYLPIKKGEVSKFILISSMMILILFIYSAQRIVKDAIVVSYMGAELISTIKLYGVLPSAIIMMLIYTKLSDLLNKTVIFHLLNIFFISYFLAFTFFINPYIDSFHFNLTNLSEAFPYFKYLFFMLEKWSYSLYFILAELWGSMMLALMFWQTSNQVFKIEEAKRIYPLLGFFGQIGMLISSLLVELFTNAGYVKSGWKGSLIYINLSVLSGAVLLSALFWILSNFLVSPDVINAEIINKKKKAGFFESLKHVFSSKYIGLIALLILCYGISINIVEGVWKAQARIIFNNPQKYASFMSTLQKYTAITSAVAMLAGSYILNLISWRFAALLTPIIIFVTGVMFFIFSIYQVEIVTMFPIFTVTPIIIAVFIGLIQNVLSKGIKYAFFDATKEIAYIPLSERLKSKGKAAADVIGGRLGKSGGAFVQWVMLSLIPGSTLVTLSPILFIIFLFVILVWFVAVNILAKEFYKITKNN